VLIETERAESKNSRISFDVWLLLGYASVPNNERTPLQPDFGMGFEREFHAKFSCAGAGVTASPRHGLGVVRISIVRSWKHGCECSPRKPLPGIRRRDAHCTWGARCTKCACSMSG
jgi:hypothetical protein